MINFPKSAFKPLFTASLRACSTKAPTRARLRDKVYIIPIHSEEAISKAIKVDELAKIEEYTKAMMIAINKPKKAERYIKDLLKNLRYDHIGLPAYTHLLELHSKILISLQEYEEAELQIKNTIEHSRNRMLYDPEFRIQKKVDLLTLYLHHFKAKASDFAETLINDPDMNKISFEKQAEVNFLTGIAKFYDEAVSFKKCKDYLKHALSMTLDPQKLSIILHNLAVMNFAERCYLNKGDDLTEEERFKRIGMSEQIRDKTIGTEVDDRGNLRFNPVLMPTEEKMPESLKEAIPEHIQYDIDQLFMKRMQEKEKTLLEKKEEADKKHKESQDRLIHSAHLKDKESVEYIEPTFYEDNKQWLTLSKEDIENEVIPIMFQLNDSKENSIFDKIEAKEFDVDTDFNEVIPVLFASIVYAHQDPAMRNFKTMEHLIFGDKTYSYLKNPVCFQSILLLSHILLASKDIHDFHLYQSVIYTVYFANKNSKKMQSRYFLDYANLLLAAYYQHIGQTENALQILTKIERNTTIDENKPLERLFVKLMGEVLKTNLNYSEDLPREELIAKKRLESFRKEKGISFLERYQEIKNEGNHSKWDLFFNLNLSA
ncbi:unnamed protein product [Moneuplotes crassus]|uniref:Uncharacterized protein n=1 Tax=Euplotes crassus TaxID=5936 RepID=A0AAD1U680_EUPCR|nr:unnamed protein product [Moneuplotes crassus]